MSFAKRKEGAPIMFYEEPAIVADLDRLAHLEGTNRSAIIRGLIRHYLSKNRSRLAHLEDQEFVGNKRSELA